MPKGSIRDSGLTNFIQGITKREQLLNYPNVGAAFEAFIAEEIIKGIQATDNVNWKHYYFRTRNGARSSCLGVTLTLTCPSIGQVLILTRQGLY